MRVQLLGQYPEWLAENAARAVALGSWGVDLNCGCPSKLVNGSGGGATLLKDPELIYRGAKAMREAVPADLPVTVKVLSLIHICCSITATSASAISPQITALKTTICAGKGGAKPVSYTHLDVYKRQVY